MTITADEFRAKSNQAYWSGQADREEAKKITLPDCVTTYLDTVEDDLKKSVPNGFREADQSSDILVRTLEKFIRIARKALKENNIDELKYRVYIIEMNLYNLAHDLEVYRVEEGRKAGGKKPKRKKWAEIVASYLAKEYSELKFPAVWQQIPLGESSDSLESDIGEIEFYRDEEKIIGIVHTRNEDKTDTLTRSTFQKNYFSPAKRG